MLNRKQLGNSSAFSKCIGQKKPHPLHESVIQKKPLTPIGIYQLLGFGNAQFIEYIKNNKINLSDLSEGNRNPKEVLWVCSDARAGQVIGIETYTANPTAIIYSAGNSVTLGLRPSYQIILDLMKTLQYRPLLKVQGHYSCGAVLHSPSKENPNHPKDIRTVLEHVRANNEIENARWNIISIAESELVGDLKKPTYHFCYFDWRSDEPVHSTNNTSQIMKEIFNIRKEAGLVTLKDFETQYAHSVIVSSVNDRKNLLPVDPRSIFGIERANEAFVVTANANISLDCSGFDSVMLGSILYSLINNKTNMVVLLNANEDTLFMWKTELDMWFKGLEKSSNQIEKEIGRRYIIGEIQIQPFLFHMNSGKAENVFF